MLVSLFLAALVSLPPATVEVDAFPAVVTGDFQDPLEQDLLEEYGKRRKAADGNVENLWAVADWCEANGLTTQFRSCLRAVLKLDAEDKKAHTLLGHVLYEGTWFTTEKKMLAHQKKREAELRKKEAKEAKAKGLVNHEGQWVRPEDVPFLEQGFVKDESGTWITPEEQKKLAEGWVRQDLEWISGRLSI